MSSSEHSPCAGCHQRCCINYTVAVTGYDAWLIATRLQLAMEEFLIYYPSEKAEPDNFRLSHLEQTFKIALGKKEVEGDARPCIFWLPLPEGYACCGIYQFRPLVCQNYPVFLSDGIVQLRPDLLCPQGSWNLSSMDLPEWRHRLLRFQMEYDIYARVVEQWNACVMAEEGDGYSISVYYAYLMTVYNRMDAVRRKLTPTQETAILQQWGECSASLVNPLRQDAQRIGRSFDPVWTEFLSDLRLTIDGFPAREVQVKAEAQCLDDSARQSQTISAA